MKVIIALFSLIVAASAGCPPFWVQYRGQCYRYFNEPLTHLGATNFCMKFGSCDGQIGRLLSVENARTDNFIHLLLSDFVIEPPTFPTWLGLTSDPNNPDVWTWASGAPLLYTNWGNNQPGGNEPCARTLPNEMGHTWREVACDRELRFICEMSAAEPGLQ
ncbi:alpha-N-acetylgalactosamine-specific lectin-like [Anneissia japonica]|uniref:alpha-N-acetylgalactosamine-specific lectin-like n=1 Tax=Anneissia japonica TaxID=1529436 RepID=UPI0014255B83|nr:alpha-N-acetylgalactosamine-specific lectin-like [Anneissia japonica]